MSLADKSYQNINQGSIGIPINMDLLLPTILGKYQYVQMPTNNPKINSNYDIIEWVLKGHISEQDYIDTFHRTSFNSARALSVKDVLAFVVYTKLFSSNTKNINETGDISLLSEIRSEVMNPLMELLVNNTSFVGKARVFDEYHIKAIRQELVGGKCKKYGKRYYFWLDCSMDPQYDEAWTKEIWRDLNAFDRQEVRASAIKGFLNIFERAASQVDEDYFSALDWFIDQAHLFDYPNARRRLLKKPGRQTRRDRRRAQLPTRVLRASSSLL